ncbi:MAG: phosphatase PAP2 family protein [Deltaproteobacteria bacterium]|nr:phosphatase PAP2 family protein [Deltaproteobacteria bacterium]
MEAIANLDRSIFLALNGDGGAALDAVMQIFTWLGDAIVLAPLVLALLFFVNRAKFAPRFALVAIATASASVVTMVAKHAINRARPLAALGAATVHVVGKPVFERALPSGHATVAATVWLSLALIFPRWRIPLIAVALISGYSRIYVGAHYPADVLAGFAVGTAFVVATHYFLKRSGLNTRMENLRWLQKR